jgi:polyhydroxyalkanoate synthesis repressor PhaR
LATADTITIKKYPNRRLYDTRQSQYVNLEYIKQLILDHKDFEIVDSKSGENLTKSVLLQIISEQETSDDQSLLTNTLLKQLIRFYGGDMQVFVRQYLEQSLANFLKQQDVVQGMMKNLVDSSPMGMFGKMMEQNMDAWSKFTHPKDKDDDKP